MINLGNRLNIPIALSFIPTFSGNPITLFGFISICDSLKLDLDDESKHKLFIAIKSEHMVKYKLVFNLQNQKHGAI